MSVPSGKEPPGAHMTNGRPRRRSIFTGVVLIVLGLIFLAQNFRGEFGFWRLFSKWWPLLLILWGVAKLIDRLAAQRSGEGAPPTITGGGILLVNSPTVPRPAPRLIRGVGRGPGPVPSGHSGGG